MNKPISRSEWKKLSITERVRILGEKGVDCYDKYLSVTMRLRKRFSRGGYIITEIGGKPAPFRALEDMAWNKYVVNAQ